MVRVRGLFAVTIGAIGSGTRRGGIGRLALVASRGAGRRKTGALATSFLWYELGGGRLACCRGLDFMSAGGMIRGPWSGSSGGS